MNEHGHLRSFLVFGVVAAVALAISGALYVRSRSADFHRHAEVLEAFGEAARADELLSKQVLAARFGLLNQYDPLNATELDLTRATGSLGARVAATVGDDPALDEALRRLDGAVSTQRQAVERFKAENSILRNSVYYLPTAARELIARLPPEAPRDEVEAIHGLTEAALLYDLVGDGTAREVYARAFARMETAPIGAAAAKRGTLLLTHARVIRDKQATVDDWVKLVESGSLGQRLAEVERLYEDRFGAAVVTSNLYRRILYGWSVFLAIAVGAASLQLRRLYAGMERRVLERTTELTEALGELWGEMRLAHKIQAALVPLEPTLFHCDVAAKMKPAADVGGDYYDVINAGGREWILIGDVSGHGVSAGLVMMMCHTAVRTVLRGNPGVSPQELLGQVNTVLTENIRQLGEDKYMTITAFRREPGGTVCFAGAHQDVLVYREGSDTVETFETRGTWLGLKKDIAESMVEKSLTLGAGDVLVVYTDGITEAMRQGTMFETSGLRDILSLSRGKTAKEILEEAFRALDGFEVADDATMLVVRQL
jgi:serine phosphatase RsbU (regulator of sigma subunit)